MPRRRNPDPNQKVWYQKKLYIGVEIDEALENNILNSQKICSFTLVNANDRLYTLTTIEDKKALLEAIDSKLIITRATYDARTKKKQHPWDIIPKIKTVLFKEKFYSGDDLKAACKNGTLNPQMKYQNTLVDAKKGTPTQLTGEALADAIDDRTVITRMAYNARINTKKRKEANPPPPKPPRTERVWHDKTLYLGADLENAIKNQIIKKRDVFHNTLVDEKTGEPTSLDGQQLISARRNGDVITRCAFRTRNRRNKTSPEIDDQNFTEELAKPKRNKVQDTFTPNDSLAFEYDGQMVDSSTQEALSNIGARIEQDLSDVMPELSTQSFATRQAGFRFFSSPGRQILNDEQLSVPTPKK